MNSKLAWATSQSLSQKKNHIKPHMVAHNFNPNTQEAGVGRSLSLRPAC